jgi:hypothetical protein
LLEPAHPKAERDRIVTVKTDLDILNNAAAAVYVTHGYVVIAISPHAGLAYAFHLHNGHQLGK